MFAIVRTGGKQYRVREGDRIDVERIDAEVGDEVTLGEVLLLGHESEDDAVVAVGEPHVAGASVTARVEAQDRGRRLSVLKYKNKTRQRTRSGHRQSRTRLAVTAILAGE